MPKPLDHKGTLAAHSFTIGSLQIKFWCSYLHSSYTWWNECCAENLLDMVILEFKVAAVYHDEFLLT